jgi:hypothetical protein
VLKCPNSRARALETIASFLTLPVPCVPGPMKRPAFSYPEPFLRAVRRGALAKSISELASDWLVLTPDIVFLPCFYGIRLWIWPEPLVALGRTRVRRALGTRMRDLENKGPVVQSPISVNPGLNFKLLFLFMYFCMIIRFKTLLSSLLGSINHILQRKRTYNIFNQTKLKEYRP